MSQDGHTPPNPLGSGLPVALDATGLFGRADEVAEAQAALAGGWRLVTLVGPPGVGKTRLARRLMADLERDGPVAFVDLATHRTRDGLVCAVAAGLGISLAAEPRGAAAAAVGRALARAQRPVVVLDNFEQLLDETDLVAGWLEAAPRACFVATSRARLRVAGERVVELGPLSVAAGVALFEERARGPRRRALSDEERAAAERIVLQVEGIPLAIELAAGRASALGVVEVLARLETGLDVLSVPRRGSADAVDGSVRGDTRHASMRAAVSWSWGLLDDKEQRTLAQASVFSGGFSLDAIEAVVDLSRGDVMDAVQGLRERSLLWARRESGAVRFGMFEIVREVARDALEGGQLGAPAEVEARHAHYYAGIDRGRPLRTEGRADAADHLAADAQNLDVAFARSSDDALVASLALSLSALFRRRGARASHEASLVRGIAAARAAGKKDVESDLLQARAALASAAGDNDVALECQRRALTVAAELGDESRRDFALARRGWDRFERGDVDGGLADIRAAVDGAARNRDLVREAYARNRAGLVLFACGSTSSALEELSRAATLASQSRDRWLRQKTLVELAQALRRLGMVEPAGQRLLELTALGAPADRVLAASVGLEHAALARASGRPADALHLVDEALAFAEDEGGPRLRSVLRVERAAALSDLDRGAEALTVLDEALAAAAHVQNPAYRAAALVEIARARSDGADIEGARAALGLAEAALAGSARDAILSGAVLCERALLTSLGDERGARVMIDEAIDALQRVGGKPLVVALAVAGLLEPARLDERRGAAEQLLARLSDQEARGAVALLRGQSAEGALARRLTSLRGGRTRREMIVGPDARFYELDGQRVSLQRQRSLRLILLALVDHAEASPGVGLSQTEVLSRGWPGEKMRPESGATRVYTSIRRLRRGGLSGVLITRDDGYLIDPAVTLRRP